MKTAAGKIRVLHAEDDANDSYFVRTALESAGHVVEFVPAETREQFISAINQGGLDLILADNCLRGFTGVEALTLARERCPQTPFVVVSGAADEQKVAAVLQAGAAGYVVKGQLWQLDAVIRRTQATSMQRLENARLKRLVSVATELSAARDMASVMSMTCRAARELAGADGADFILHEGDLCHCAEEDAIAPLWKGQRLPIAACISGWTIQNGETAAIEDVQADLRVQADTYRNTFVKSLAVVPVRTAFPVGALGIYWAQSHAATIEELELLQALAESTAGAMERIRVQTELEQQLRDRSLRLEAADRELETFSSSVSHDLRAPLRSVCGFADLLQANHAANLDPKAKSYLDKINSAATRMGAIIEDLLLFARFTRVELLPGPVRLSQTVRQIISRFQTTLPSRRVEFKVAEGLEAHGDPNLMKVVLEIFVSNAWKFSSKRADALIEFGSATQADGSTAFFVRDNGAGFDMAYASRLFKPFQRLHRQDEFPGNGIGLALAQRIIQRHGGRIWAEAAVDRGATFFFTLPATR